MNEAGNQTRRPMSVLPVFAAIVRVRGHIQRKGPDKRDSRPLEN